ncbi:RICIN domain-containing protein [Streptomyces sp. MUM 178J]|uniref:RICIN domain-containing protein n=1 Tax=Streptomyces sp. MUM 178J TaxID=2791991 RepID=UPI001F03A4F3|nr:RICIN domain-containing protein [Streptomyces sp. MUM 178J]WRQ77994.1 RICIN domain-containing protein [Streptomyces sp. MUM 178J]
MAAEDPLLLRAFRSLHPTARAVLRPDLAGTSEDAASAPGADTRSPAAASARRQLSDAYLRSYAAEAPSRTCRHLTAVMDDAVRGGVSHRSQDLDVHAEACRSCARVRAELTVVHSATASALAEVLADAESAAAARTESAAAAAARTEGGDENPPAPGEPTQGATAAAGRTVAAGRACRLPALVAASPSRAAAVAGVTVAALAAAAVAFSTAAEDTRRPLARATAAPPAPALPADEPPAVPSASPSRPGGGASGSASPSRTPTAPAATKAPAAAAKANAKSNAKASAKASPTPTVHTPPRPPVGFQLVNRATGLCVGVQSAFDGAMLRLEDCNTGTRQRWETVAAGYGAYQFRNVGTRKCLDGTGGGGNVVRVVQNECRDSYSSQRTVQLWVIKPEADGVAFRLQFVPPVPASDYSSHLLGPEDWWRENPPRKGSYLAQLPNYYNSESFVFTMNRGV